VTVLDFRKFVQATGYKTEAETSGTGGDGLLSTEWKTRPKYSWSNLGKFPVEDGQPVVNVSWNDAAKFCEWLSKKEEKQYRLPTEAEWEFACRAGTTTAWSFGNDPKDIMQYVALGVTLCPVGRRPPNPFGLFEMHGGVQEWVGDWLGPFPQTPQTDPTGPKTGEARIRRGGHNAANYCLVRSAAREPAPTSHRAFFIGFRVACEVEQKD
jgi:formylglycine-generating enzyme required for sulfatase activity